MNDLAGHRAAMTPPRRRLLEALVTVTLTLAAVVPSPVTAAELRCPPRMPGPHEGFEQVGPVPTAHWLLRDMRLFDGPPGEELKVAPAELAPDQTLRQRDGFTSSWRFAGNEDLLMVCRYNGAGTYYRTRLQKPPTGCSMRDDNGLRQAWCELP
jgi:hypothetical protein